MTFRLCPGCELPTLRPGKTILVYSCAECKREWKIQEVTPEETQVDKRPMPLFDRRCRRKSDKGVSQ